jgi:hypothetical protein
MDRRAFLDASAASGLMLAAPAVGARPDLPPPLPRPGPVDDMDAYLARLDAGMERIGAWSLTASYPGFAGDRQATDTLARSAVQTMYLTGMLGDLPVEQQLHPGMQERMWAALPLMDDAFERMHGFLESRTPADLARVQSALRGPDRFAERMAEVLDEQAALTGVSAWRRQQMRSTLTLAAWRMASQPPALIIGEYQDKIARVDGSDIAAEARKRWLAARVGERVFWARADMAPGGLLSGSALTDGPHTERDKRIASGAKGMGIGLLIFAGGVAMVAAGAGGNADVLVVVGLGTATVGSIWFLVGFLTLLIGLMTPDDSPAPASPPRGGAH